MFTPLRDDSYTKCTVRPSGAVMQSSSHVTTFFSPSRKAVPWSVREGVSICQDSSRDWELLPKRYAYPSDVVMVKVRLLPVPLTSTV